MAGIRPTFAQPGPFATLQNSTLCLMTDWLTTNGVPGLTNSPANLMVSSVGSSSLRGGRVTLVSTQAWVKRYNGSAYYPDYANKVVVDPTGNVVVAGDSMGLDLKYAALTIKYGGDGTPLWTNTLLDATM